MYLLSVLIFSLLEMINECLPLCLRTQLQSADLPHTPYFDNAPTDLHASIIYSLLWRFYLLSARMYNFANLF